MISYKSSNLVWAVVLMFKLNIKRFSRKIYQTFSARDHRDHSAIASLCCQIRDKILYVVSLTWVSNVRFHPFILETAFFWNLHSFGPMNCYSITRSVDSEALDNIMRCFESTGCPFCLLLRIIDDFSSFTFTNMLWAVDLLLKICLFLYMIFIIRLFSI